MRSSVVQYDSDCDETQRLQHNSNGIARVVVGGNEAEDAKPTTAAAGFIDASSPSSLTGTIDNGRESGDGANSTDTTVQAASTANHKGDNVDNALDGNYDNIESVKAATDNSKHNMPATVEELLKFCDADGDKDETVNMNNDHVAVEDEEEEEEYQLVLTGLKHLTRGTSQVSGTVTTEQRYPHQIAAAMSTSQLSNSESFFSDIEPIVTQPQRPSSVTPLQSNSTKTKGSQIEAEPIAPSVQKRSGSQHRERQKPARPHSMSSTNGLHLLKTTNELRRSTRRKGQYTSIAEYEKLQNVDKHEQPNTRQENDCNNIAAAVSNYPKSRNSSFSCMASVVKDTPPISPRNRRKSRTSGSSPKICRSSASLLNSHQSRPFTENSQVLPKVQLRKEGRSFGRQASKEASITPRRASIVSIASVPNNVVLRRVSSNLEELRPCIADKKVTADKRSRSFDRKSLKLSIYKQSNDGVSQNGLTLVGSRNSLASHGRSSHKDGVADSRMLQHLTESQLSLGEPHIVPAKTPVLDGKRGRAVASIQLAPPPKGNVNRGTKPRYVSLPNNPRMSFSRHPANNSHNNWNGGMLDQNPGFRRFFDSILAFGPNGNQSNSKDAIKPNGSHNQPDIVLESLNPDHSSRADDSDSESSIRSSASAYWPPELKQQSNCDDFEEAASWKFHGPVGKNRHPVNVV